MPEINNRLAPDYRIHALHGESPAIPGGEMAAPRGAAEAARSTPRDRISEITASVRERVPSDDRDLLGRRPEGSHLSLSESRKHILSRREGRSRGSTLGGVPDAA